MMDLCEKGEVSLYHINPIGVGTPYIESLPSYIKRLAMAHSVSPTILTRTILHNSCFHTLYNPVSDLAKTLTSALELMTGIAETKKLYLGYESQYIYREHLWLNSIKVSSLFRKQSAWCPLCFDEGLVNNNIYEQMLWCFSSVTVCSKHQIKLFEKCPRCKSTVDILRWNSIVGYCNKCSSWLGLSEQTRLQLESVDSFKYYYLNGIVSQLLVNASSYGDLVDTPQLNCKANFQLLAMYLCGDYVKESFIDRPAGIRL